MMSSANAGREGGSDVSVAPSVSYSITVRLDVPSRGRAVSELTHVVEQAGGAVTALDVAPFGHERLRVDVTCAARDTDHAEAIVAALSAIAGVSLSKVSDRTFLLHLGGKIETQSKVPLRNRDDLSMAYTPGVARVALAIAAHPEDVRRLTIKRNSVAVVTDGSAVLGLGNIGPYAALPVMEGKAALFKRFAGIDAWPVCLDTQDTDEIVRTVQVIAPAFGGINLEDISAPRCFEVERRPPRPARHPGLPRRPARNGDCGAGRADQRPAGGGQEAELSPDRHGRRGRRGDRRAQAADRLGRHGRGGLRRPGRGAHRAGPASTTACGGSPSIRIPPATAAICGGRCAGGTCSSGCPRRTS